jgi:hypothetical protein
MKRQNGWITVAFAGLVMVAGTACDNTSRGARQDAEIAADDARRAGDRAGDATADAADDAADAARRAGDATADATDGAVSATTAAATTAVVKSALTADTEVDASDIDVDTDGATKTVTLKGRVDNQAQRTAAERIARDKAEGYTIVNELTIGGPQ